MNSTGTEATIARLEELDVALGRMMRRCVKCGSPMLIYSKRVRVGLTEYLCPRHGIVIVSVKEGKL